MPFPETSARMAVFEWCNTLRQRFGERVPRSVLEQGVPFAAATGGVIRVIGPQGIFKPRDFDLPLSITTSPESPYKDAISPDGNLLYNYRGTDSNHPDNVALRHAMRRNVPLVYFRGLLPGIYLTTWPVFIRGDDPGRLQFSVWADDRMLDAGQTAEEPEVAIRRRYETTMVRRRIHQQLFRERVVAAYRRQCAMCRLRHAELLDAAHIVPDSEDGEPVVSNGLSLCKLHHAAFDGYLVSVTPDFRIQLRPSLLEEEDGPVLEHGLKRLHGLVIQLPNRESQRPDRDSLARHFEHFRTAA